MSEFLSTSIVEVVKQHLIISIVLTHFASMCAGSLVLRKRLKHERPSLDEFIGYGLMIIASPIWIPFYGLGALTKLILGLEERI